MWNTRQLGLVIGALFLLCTTSALGLTPKDVLKMADDGDSPQQIIDAIIESEPAFTITEAQFRWLEAQGIAKKVLHFIQDNIQIIEAPEEPVVPKHHQKKVKPAPKTQPKPLVKPPSNPVLEPQKKPQAKPTHHVGGSASERTACPSCRRSLLLPANTAPDAPLSCSYCSVRFSVKNGLTSESTRSRSSYRPKARYEKTWSWYGWKLLVVDVVSLSLIAVGFEDILSDSGMAVFGSLMFLVSGPAVHAVHRNGTGATISLLLRLTIPIVGIIISDFESVGPAALGFLLAASADQSMSIKRTYQRVAPNAYDRYREAKRRTGRIKSAPSLLGYSGSF